MSKPTTLFDKLYRATFQNETLPGYVIPNYALREKLVAARRFVLDDSMSVFLGELALRAFIFNNSIENVSCTPAQKKLRYRRLESLRVSAMGPHRITWVEYQLRSAKARADELLGRYTPSEERPKIEGWLIEQHEQLDTAFSVHIFSWDDRPDVIGYDTWTFPLMFTWTIDDSMPPWPRLTSLRKGKSADAAVATGIANYDVPYVTMSQSPMLEPVQKLPLEAVMMLIKEWAGVIRMVWALLACIDDIPMIRGTVTPDRSFFAKGRIRKYLSHHTLVLDVPAKKQTKLASKLVGSLVKRVGHGVRQHWRKDWRHPPADNCPALQAGGMHEWTEQQCCAVCAGRRIRIPEHRRGDASKGLNITDYLVRHPVDNRSPA